MALIEMALPFNLRAVQAGDAAEMVSRLTSEVAAATTAQEDSIVDFTLAGAGSGPEWEAWIVTGDSGSAPIAAALVTQPRFVAAVGGNPTEALFYLKQRLAAAIGGNPMTVYKVEVAGAGDGPTYMAVAMFANPGL